MAPFNFIFLLVSLLLSSTFISPSSSKPITLELSRRITKTPSSHNPRDIIFDIAQSTLERAFHLKHLNNNKNPSQPTYATTPLYAAHAGDYIISLALGTPPQKVPAFFDTGSSLVWVPCTSHYSCANCTQNNENITTFLPKKSSSKHSVKCNNKKCRWLDQSDVLSSCPTCNRLKPGSCDRPCFYNQAYGSGDTFGNAIFENLNLQGKVVPGFLVGCSIRSETIPVGIAGFGRSPMSLQNQLKINKFSYCLVSHKLDDTEKSSTLILGENGVIPGVKYTPFLRNPNVFPFNQYYYVQLAAITVGTETIKLQKQIQMPGSNGNGGTIVDSGSTLTAMAPQVFDAIVEDFFGQMSVSQKKQAVLADLGVGNMLCMEVTGQRKQTFPEIVFRFRGGATMELPVASYLHVGVDYLCLPFVNVTMDVGQDGNGPGIILGNYQQQNYYMEYDLKHERLGLKKKIC